MEDLLAPPTRIEVLTVSALGLVLAAVAFLL